MQDATSALIGPGFTDADFQPGDYYIGSVLAQEVSCCRHWTDAGQVPLLQVHISDRFIAHYEKWLEREVYRARIDWDALVDNKKQPLFEKC